MTNRDEMLAARKKMEIEVDLPSEQAVLDRSDDDNMRSFDVAVLASNVAMDALRQATEMYADGDRVVSLGALSEGAMVDLCAYVRRTFEENGEGDLVEAEVSSLLDSFKRSVMAHVMAGKTPLESTALVRQYQRTEGTEGVTETGTPPDVA